MADNASCTVYVGNLDERVTDRIVYDILIQAGPLVNLYIPRDKETEKLRGFAFAQYETEETAEYAVKVFSGLVTLYNRTLKFVISGQYQDNKPSTISPTLTSSLNLNPPRSHPAGRHDFVNKKFMTLEFSPNSVRLPTSCRSQEHQVRYNRYSYDNKNHQHSYGYRSHYNNNSYDYGRRVYGNDIKQ